MKVTIHSPQVKGVDGGRLFDIDGSRREWSSVSITADFGGELVLFFPDARAIEAFGREMTEKAEELRAERKDGVDKSS